MKYLMFLVEFLVGAGLCLKGLETPQTPHTYCYMSGFCMVLRHLQLDRYSMRDMYTERDKAYLCSDR